MSNIQESLTKLLECDGAIGAAIVDAESGMMLGQVGPNDLELAAAANTEIVRAKLKAMKTLEVDDVIEDILITLGKEYHIIRPICRTSGTFFYFTLNKDKANLALARRKLHDVEADVQI